MKNLKQIKAKDFSNCPISKNWSATLHGYTPFMLNNNISAFVTKRTLFHLLYPPKINTPLVYFPLE